jgi:hypothetical protein
MAVWDWDLIPNFQVLCLTPIIEGVVHLASLATLVLSVLRKKSKRSGPSTLQEQKRGNPDGNRNAVAVSCTIFHLHERPWAPWLACCFCYRGSEGLKLLLLLCVLPRWIDFLSISMWTSFIAPLDGAMIEVRNSVD